MIFHCYGYLWIKTTMRPAMQDQTRKLGYDEKNKIEKNVEIGTWDMHGDPGYGKAKHRQSRNDKEQMGNKAGWWKPSLKEPEEKKRWICKWRHETNHWLGFWYEVSLGKVSPLLDRRMQVAEEKSGWKMYMGLQIFALLDPSVLCSLSGGTQTKSKTRGKEQRWLNEKKKKKIKKQIWNQQWTAPKREPPSQVKMLSTLRAVLLLTMQCHAIWRRKHNPGAGSDKSVIQSNRV